MANYDYSTLLEDLQSLMVTAIIPVYNGGDKETGFKLVMPLTQSQNQIQSSGLLKKEAAASTYTFGLLLPVNEDEVGLTITDLELENQDTGILIDTNARLIQGITFSNNTYTTTGTVYNNYISQGDFFKIVPQTDWLLTTPGMQGIPQILCLIDPEQSMDFSGVSISYDTLYI